MCTTDGEESEISFVHPDDILRFINLDETHHKYSTKGDSGGSRTNRFSNSSFPRAGERVVAGSMHATGVYMTNPHEVLPPLYIYETSVKEKDNAKIDPEWVKGLPKVTGKFGHDVEQVWESFVAARKKGSMDTSLWHLLIDEVILTLYPNVQKEVVRDANGKLLKGPLFIKTDAGPGRLAHGKLAKEANSVEFLEMMADKGVHIILGLPNGTSATQEMDQAYADYQPECRKSTMRLASIKLKNRVDARKKAHEKETGAASAQNVVTDDTRRQDLEEYLAEVDAEENNNNETEDEDNFEFQVNNSVCHVSIGNHDLPFIVNGLPTDPIEKRPFDYIFTRSNIWKWWVAVGFIPMNRNACNDEKVRYELGEGGAPPDASNRLELLEADYMKFARELDELGFNGDILDLKLPVYKPPAPAALNNEELAKQLVEKKALSKAGRSFKLGCHVITAGPVVLAAKMQKKLEEERIKAKEAKAAAKDDSAEGDAMAAFQAWTSKNMPYKMSGKDYGQPDIGRPQMRCILAYLLKKGNCEENISKHDKSRATIWERLQKFGANNGEQTWVGQMQTYHRLFWSSTSTSTEQLLKQPPLFTAGPPKDNTALMGDTVAQM